MLHLGPEGHRRLRLVSALSLLQYHTSCSLCNAPLYSHKKGKSWQCYSENSFDLTDPLKGFQVPSKGPWTTLEEPPRVLPTGPGQQLSAPWTGFCPSTNIHYIHSSALLWPSPCECTLCFPAPPKLLLIPQNPLQMPAACWRLSWLLQAKLGLLLYVLPHPSSLLLQ